MEPGPYRRRQSRRPIRRRHRIKEPQKKIVSSRLLFLLVGRRWGRRSRWPWWRRLLRLRQILDHGLFLPGNVAVHHFLDLRRGHCLELAEIGIYPVRIAVNHRGLAQRTRFSVEGLALLEFAGKKTGLRFVEF